MNKEDFLQYPIEQALLKIDFLNRYKALSNNYKVRDDTFVIDNAKVIEIAERLGYGFKYSKSKEFYLEEFVNGYTLKFGFTIRYNSFDFGLSVISDAKKIHTSAPWGFLVQLLSDGKEKVPKATFADYVGIENILKEAVKIYEDIKKELLE